MQPDSSVTFISARNKLVWAGKRRGLARHTEVLRHIAQQAGIPPLSQSKSTRLFRVYLGCAGIMGVLVGLFILTLAITWFIMADFWRYFGDRTPAMGCVVVLALLLTGSLSTTRKIYDEITYPPCVLQLYQKLITSRQLAVGEVQSIETLTDSKYVIRYQFTRAPNNERITGEYLAKRQFSVGTKMAVIYLDASCHVLL